MMKINQRFQALHKSGGETGETDWVSIQEVERDICLLYHQLADYSWVIGDLYYGSVYSLPYWEYLDIQGIEPEQSEFIRTGCLVLLFAMASDELDQSAVYLTRDKDRYSAASAAVRSLTGVDGDTRRLADAVLRLFAMIDAGVGSLDKSDDAKELRDLSSWIHQRFVRRYFEDRAKEFSTNPYYRGEPPEST